MAAVLMESGWDAAEGQQTQDNPHLLQGQQLLQILLAFPGDSVPEAKNNRDEIGNEVQAFKL